MFLRRVLLLASGVCFQHFSLVNTACLFLWMKFWQFCPCSPSRYLFVSGGKLLFATPTRDSCVRFVIKHCTDIDTKPIPYLLQTDIAMLKFFCRASAHFFHGFLSEATNRHLMLSTFHQKNFAKKSLRDEHCLIFVSLALFIWWLMRRVHGDKNGQCKMVESILSASLKCRIQRTIQGTLKTTSDSDFAFWLFYTPRMYDFYAYPCKQVIFQRS